MSSLLQPKIDVAPSPVSEGDRRAMSSKSIEFQVLGPTEARHGGRAIPVNGVRRPALVTRQLVVDAGRAVSAGTLLEDVWEDQAPPRGVETLQSHVSQLRKVLGDRLQGGITGGWHMGQKCAT